MKEEKGIVSKTLDDKPALFPDLHWVWLAFNWLSGRRSYGMGGALPITAEAMLAYLTMTGIRREDDVDFYLHMIPLLDDVWIAEAYRKKETDRAKTPNRRR